MNRFYFQAIILLAAGLLIAGLAVTAGSLEDLEGKPVPVLAARLEPGQARISLLGDEYEIKISDIAKNPLPANFTLEKGLQKALLRFQELAPALKIPDLQ